MCGCGAMIASWRIADIVGACGSCRIAFGAIVPLLVVANCRTLKTGGLNGIVPRFGACVGALVRPVCRSSVVARLWGVGRGCAPLLVVLSLSLCSRARYFRPCWLFSLSGIFSVGFVAFVRLWAVLKPLAVWVSLQPYCRWRCPAWLVFAFGDLWTGSRLEAFHFLPYPCPMIYYFARGRCDLTTPI